MEIDVEAYLRRRYENDIIDIEIIDKEDLDLEYWSLVETGYEEPASGVTLTDAQQKRLDEHRLKDLKVKNYLFQAIDRTILETILQKDTSKQIWDSMKKMYEGNARVKRSILQALRKEFEILEMKSGEKVKTISQG